MSVSFSSYNDCVCSTFVFLQKKCTTFDCSLHVFSLSSLVSFLFFSLGFTSTNLTMKWHTTHVCRQRITSLTFHLFDLTTLFDPCVRSVGLWKEVTSTSPHDAFDNQALVDLLCMQSSAITCTPFVDVLYITQKWTITVLQYVTTALPSSPLK